MYAILQFFFDRMMPHHAQEQIGRVLHRRACLVLSCRDKACAPDGAGVGALVLSGQSVRSRRRWRWRWRWLALALALALELGFEMRSTTALTPSPHNNLLIAPVLVSRVMVCDYRLGCPRLAGVGDELCIYFI